MAKKTLLAVGILFFGVALAAGQEKTPSPAVSLASWVLHAKLINEVLPEYQAVAVEQHIEGDVFVDVAVDENNHRKIPHVTFRMS